MERSWAALLTPPLEAAEEAALDCAFAHGEFGRRTGIVGALEKCTCADVARCSRRLLERQRKQRSASASVRAAEPAASPALGEERTLLQVAGVPRARPGSPPLRKHDVAVYMQVASHEARVVEDLCQCVATIAAVPTRRLHVFVSLVDKGGAAVPQLARFTQLNRSLADSLSEAHVRGGGGVTLKVLLLPNAGGDVGQFLSQLHRSAGRRPYDLVLKIHSKTEDVWRERSMATLCGSVEQAAAPPATPRLLALHGARALTAPPHPRARGRGVSARAHPPSPAHTHTPPPPPPPPPPP